MKISKCIASHCIACEISKWWTNISPLPQKKILISDKIKTHCDQGANMAAFLQGLLNFLCCRLLYHSRTVPAWSPTMKWVCVQLFCSSTLHWFLFCRLKRPGRHSQHWLRRQETSTQDIHSDTVKTPISYKSKPTHLHNLFIKFFFQMWEIFDLVLSIWHLFKL